MNKPPHPPKPGTREWCIEHPNSNHPGCEYIISVPINMPWASISMFFIAVVLGYYITIKRIIK